MKMTLLNMNLMIQRRRVIKSHNVVNKTKRNKVSEDPNSSMTPLKMRAPKRASTLLPLHSKKRVWTRMMTNHYHLLISPHVPDSMPRFMRYLSGGYVRFINARYGRTGTLWDGRYRASLVDEDRYFWACHRYIELNPVRAGVTHGPGDYQWSSYARNAFGLRGGCVVPHAVYQALGDCEMQRQDAYRSLFRETLDDSMLEEVRGAIRHNHVLGNERFKAQVETMLARRLGPGRPGRPRLARAPGEVKEVRASYRPGIEIRASSRSSEQTF